MADTRCSIDIGKGAEKRFFSALPTNGQGVAFSSDDFDLPTDNVETVHILRDKQPRLSKLSAPYEFVVAIGDFFAINYAKYFAAAKGLPLYVLATTPYFLNACDAVAFTLIGGIYREVEGARPVCFAFDTKRTSGFSKEDMINSFIIVAAATAEDNFEIYFRNVVFGVKYNAKLFSRNAKCLDDVYTAMEIYAANSAALKFAHSMKQLLEIRAEGKFTSLSLLLALTESIIARARKLPTDFYAAWRYYALKQIAVDKLFLTTVISDIKTPDMDLRMDYLTDVLKKSDNVASGILGDGISAASYSFLLKRYAIKRGALRGAVNSLTEAAQRIVALSKKAGGKDRETDVRLSEETLALCAELYPDITPLTLMKFTGVFDEYFMEA